MSDAAAEVELQNARTIFVGFDDRVSVDEIDAWLERATAPDLLADPLLTSEPTLGVQSRRSSSPS